MRPLPVDGLVAPGPPGGPVDELRRRAAELGWHRPTTAWAYDPATWRWTLTLEGEGRAPVAGEGDQPAACICIAALAEALARAV